MKVPSSTLIAAKNALNDATVWLILLDIKLRGANYLYVCRDTKTYTYNGIDYEPVPFHLVEWKEDMQGNVSQLDVGFMDVTGKFKGMLHKIDFDDAEVTLRILYTGTLSGGETDTDRPIITERFRISGWSGDWNTIVFHLSHKNLMSIQIPSRKCIRYKCGFIYKGDRCGYGGVLPGCDFTLNGANGCITHSNEDRFGGFPGIPFGRNEQINI